jgi:hypothetical protein
VRFRAPLQQLEMRDFSTLVTAVKAAGFGRNIRVVKKSFYSFAPNNAALNYQLEQ